MISKRDTFMSLTRHPPMAADDGEHGVGDEDKAHRQHRLDVLVEEPQRDDDEKPREVVGV